MKCPGQDSRYWDSDAIFNVKCPGCGNIEEFFKDEPTRKCRKCGYRIINPKMDFGCASYCKFAAQCVGELPAEIIKENRELLKDRVAVKMRIYFGNDLKRIRHAGKVAEYAEIIAKNINADLAVVLAAAYLHDIGIKESERKYNSSAAKYQEQEGPPVAMDILTGLNASPDLIEEVCDIIAHHHHPREEESINYKSLYDADQIVNLEENYNEKEPDNDKLESTINRQFLTDAGRKLARDVLIRTKRVETG